jgi:hypothetical protein
MLPYAILNTQKEPWVNDRVAKVLLIRCKLDIAKWATISNQDMSYFLARRVGVKSEPSS